MKQGAIAVPFSIFNSKQAIDWLKCYSLMLIFFGLFINTWEQVVAHRDLRVQPVSDGYTLFEKARTAAQKAGKTGTLIVGSSRAVLDLHLETLAKYIPRYPIQLAIDGSVFRHVLADLAEDPTILGTVLVDATLFDFWVDKIEDRAPEWINLYHVKRSETFNFYQSFEEKLQAGLNQWLPARAKGAKPYRHGLCALIKPDLWNDYVMTRESRARQADFSKTDPKRLLQFHLEDEKKLAQDHPITLTQLVERIHQVNQWVQKIQKRGGRVIFIHYPVAPEIYAIEEQFYPKAKYWDGILRENLHADLIHFKDHHTLLNFTFPDGVHLDYRDSPAFTEALVRVIDKTLVGWIKTPDLSLIKR